MTTKPASAVKRAPEESLELIAYASVESIPTAEPHGKDRLGYHVWTWLRTRRDTLESVVSTAKAGLLISEEEALERIRASLLQHGVSL